MSSVVVSGLVLPVALGGHPALDFCNTRAGWGSPAPKEYLSSYDHLAVWTRETGVFPPRDVAAFRRAARADPVAARDALAEALELRDAAYAVLLGSRNSRPFAVVAAQAGAARAAATLRRSPPGVRAGGAVGNPAGRRTHAGAGHRGPGGRPALLLAVGLRRRVPWCRLRLAFRRPPACGVDGATWPCAATGRKPAGTRSAARQPPARPPEGPLRGAGCPESMRDMGATAVSGTFPPVARTLGYLTD